MSRALFKLVWTENALSDIEGILEYVAVHDGELRSVAVEKQIQKSTVKLKRHPLSGRVVPELGDLGIKDYREVFSGNFRIFYRRHNGKVIYIMAVLDSRRDFEEVLFQKLML